VGSTWYSRFQEFFSGVKSSTKSRAYPIISVFIRRLIYIPLLLVVPSVTFKFSTIMFWEFLTLVYFIWSKPLDLVQNNFIEGSNLIFFTALTGMLFYLKDEQSWDETWEIIFTTTILLNNMIIAIILLSTFSV